MAMHHRLRRLERAAGPTGDGRRRCRVCKDGTEPTGVLVVMDGQPPPTRPSPCPGCGRDEPMVFVYGLAVPEDWQGPRPAPETAP
jgi:hypothetical protein